MTTPLGIHDDLETGLCVNNNTNYPKSKINWIKNKINCPTLYTLQKYYAVCECNNC